MYKILLFICFSAFLRAQDSVYTIQPVEIISTRPVNDFQSYYMLKKEGFENMEALSFEKFFSKVPGLIINDRNNPSLGDKISIRGIGTRSSFGVRGIKILADNIPLTFPDGQSQTNNIDLYSTGRIEILKGPVSSFYGNSAGGILKFQSELSKPGFINITPELIIGSFNFRKYSIKASGTYDNNSYLISFNNLNYNGLRPHSSRKLYILNSIYKYHFSDHLLINLVLNYFNSPYLLNPGSLDKTALENDRNSVREFNKQQGTGEKTAQFQSGATVYFSESDFNLEATIYFIKRNVLNPIPGRIIDLKRISGGFRSAAMKKINIDNLSLEFNAGADVELQNDLRNEFENTGLISTDLEPEEIFENLRYGNKLIDQEENVLGTAPFFSVQMVLDRRLGFLSGVRYDNYTFKVEDSYLNNSGRRNMSRVSPSLGLFFKPAVNLKIYFNYSTAFQTPTASELSNRPDAEGGFNPQLNPETIYQLELGSDYLLGKWNTSLSASIYYLNFSDLIIPYQVQNSEETYFRNAGKAENKGAEINIESFISKKIRTVLSYSLMNFKYIDYTVQRENDLFQLGGNKVPGIPMQNIYFQVEYLNQNGISGIINFSWLDEYYTNDFNGAPPGSSLSKSNFVNEDYMRVDFRTSYSLNFNFMEMIIFLGINNLFDKKYNGSVVPNAAGDRYFEPAPGRSWYAGLRIEY
jgi:iron complex outermembrane receptor protein